MGLGMMGLYCSKLLNTRKALIERLTKNYQYLPLNRMDSNMQRIVLVSLVLFLMATGSRSVLPTTALP